jgi:hypothetical protein
MRLVRPRLHPTQHPATLLHTLLRPVLPASTTTSSPRLPTTSTIPLAHTPRLYHRTWTRRRPSTTETAAPTLRYRHTMPTMRSDHDRQSTTSTRPHHTTVTRRRYHPDQRPHHPLPLQPPSRQPTRRTTRTPGTLTSMTTIPCPTCNAPMPTTWIQLTDDGPREIDAPTLHCAICCDDCHPVRPYLHKRIWKRIKRLI